MDVTDSGCVGQVSTASAPGSETNLAVSKHTFPIEGGTLSFDTSIKQTPSTRVRGKMKKRIHFGFLLVYSLVSYFSSCSAFYLPGLAPVSFCEEGKGGEDCQVREFFKRSFLIN